nr:MAG TPA: Permuted papain-like amidase enzyme, YaeF/YiiX, C92 family [Caudoviricetes sp.]
MIYLALYHGHRGGTGLKVWAARFTDGLTRILTRGRYSHCELAVRLPETADGQEYECYSASLRDKGVRRKIMPLPSDKWDLIPLPDGVGRRLETLLAQTQGQGYDLPGAFGVVFGLPENRRRWFCSEWVGAALGLPESWRFSPND